ncbi:MAG: putative peptide zinc metalloprotease protein, partial [Actinomycetota bacterium]|nr:putative peptide zinc metalloprotease protein [Actinomycetota bacterium]
ERVTVLKRWVRVAVTVWVLVVVPLLVLQLLMVLIHLPRIVGTALDSGGKQVDAIQKAFAGGHGWGAVGGIVQLVALTIPVVGILLMLANVGRRLVRSTWRKTEGRPIARGFSVVAMGGFAALLLFAWLPKSNYAPIRKGERGTLTEGIAAVYSLPSGAGPLESERAAAAAGRLDPASTPGGSDTGTGTTPASGGGTATIPAGPGPGETVPANGSTATTTGTGSGTGSSPATTARPAAASTTTAPRASTTTTSTSTTTTSTTTTIP